MNEMMETIETFDKKNQPIRHIPGPEGVRGRNSDNALILEKLGWEPTIRLADGLRVTYFWIKSQLEEVRHLLMSHDACVATHAQPPDSSRHIVPRVPMLSCASLGWCFSCWTGRRQFCDHLLLLLPVYLSARPARLMLRRC